MVQHKHQKSKPKKQPPRAKKHGKQADISEFRAQLDALGLKIIQVTSDGNCFFRALADQLDGNEEEHEKYRNMVVQYIRSNRETFEPFIEDDAPFDEYCRSMEKDGTWAGHMELQAASLVTHSNICIHLHMSPRWYIRNFDNHAAHMIHLSYHDGEHYNSVRAKEDPCDGPAKPISIKADVNLTASSKASTTACTHSKSISSKKAIHSEAINTVLAGSGCNDVEKVEQVLMEVNGDVYAAIEFLIALRETAEFAEEIVFPSEIQNKGNDRGTNSDQLKRSDSTKKCQLDDSQRVNNVKSSSMTDKIPRNKLCPCGSKKKYRSCCGTASGRTCRPVVDHEGFTKTGKRGKQGKRFAPVSKIPSAGLDGLPDMGALCI